MLVGLRGPSGTESVCEPARERASERVNVCWQAGGHLSTCCVCRRVGGCAVGSRASLQADEWQCAGLSVRRQLHPGSWEDWLLLQPDGSLPGGLPAAAPEAEGHPEPDVRPAATALHPGRCSAPSLPAPSRGQSTPACLPKLQPQVRSKPLPSLPPQTSSGAWLQTKTLASPPPQPRPQPPYRPTHLSQESTVAKGCRAAAAPRGPAHPPAQRGGCSPSGMGTPPHRGGMPPL